MKGSNDVQLNAPPQYQCDLCPKRVTTSKSLRNHKKAAHEKSWNRISCSLCDSSFYSKANLRDHIASRHTKETSFGCGICPQAFKTSTERSHHRRVHREGNIIDLDGICHCRFCPKKFNAASSLLAHQALHHDPARKPRPRKYKCSMCDKGFVNTSTLQSHIRSHIGERPFSCSVPGCKKTFTQSGHRSQHVKEHQDEELGTLFPCPICPKICPSRKSLSHHRSNVHRRAPYSQPKTCYFCGSVYSCQSGLEMHLRLHTKEKRYKCYFCPKRAPNLGHILGHIGMHTNERPYRCPGCGVRFKHLQTIKRHVTIPSTCGIKKDLRVNKKAWGRSLQCMICLRNYPFRFRQRFEIHMRSHIGEKPFPCTYLGCGKSFPRQGKLDVHLGLHQERDRDEGNVFQCSECFKGFPSQRKVDRHRSYYQFKPHAQSSQCYFCGYLCNSSTPVSHLRRHTLEKPRGSRGSQRRKFTDNGARACPDIK